MVGASFACTARDQLRLADLLLDVDLLERDAGVAPLEPPIDAPEEHGVGAAVLGVHVELDPRPLVELQQGAAEVLRDLLAVDRLGEEEAGAELVDLEVVGVLGPEAVLLRLLDHLVLAVLLRRDPRRPACIGHRALHVEIHAQEGRDVDQDARLVALEGGRDVAAGQVQDLAELLDVGVLEVALLVVRVGEEPLALDLELVALVERDAEAALPPRPDAEGPAAHRIRLRLRPGGGGARGRLARHPVGPLDGSRRGGGRGGCAAVCVHQVGSFQVK